MKQALTKLASGTSEPDVNKSEVEKNAVMSRLKVKPKNNGSQRGRGKATKRGGSSKVAGVKRSVANVKDRIELSESSSSEDDLEKMSGKETVNKRAKKKQKTCDSDNSNMESPLKGLGEGFTCVSPVVTTAGRGRGRGKPVVRRGKYSEKSLNSLKRLQSENEVTRTVLKRSSKTNTRAQVTKTSISESSSDDQ